MLYIGCHLSSSKGFEAMGKTAVEIGANTFQFFTRNPRGGRAKDIDEDDVQRFLELSKRENFGKIVAHAPYTLNPCSASEKVRNFAFIAMEDDMRRMEHIPGNYYNFHPGSHVGQGSEKGIAMIAELLNRVIKPEQSTVILLETMAGKGSEIGGTFEELREITDRVELDDKLGVCLDTCHVSDGGYSVKDGLDSVIEEFDRVMGMDRLKAIHINDSLNPQGARKDRHARIGEGYLGAEAIADVINHPALKNLPFILETPNDLEGYAREIKMLREAYRG